MQNIVDALAESWDRVVEQAIRKGGIPRIVDRSEQIQYLALEILGDPDVQEHLGLGHLILARRRILGDQIRGPKDQRRKTKVIEVKARPLGIQ